MEDLREDAPQVVEKIPEGVIDALGIESPKRVLIFLACGLVTPPAAVLWTFLIADLVIAIG
jgi:hypothetical protein